MAPIVYGLEEEFRGRVDFVYLDVSAENVRPLLSEFGFRATPHFFLRTRDGHVVWSQQGNVSEGDMRQALEMVLARAPRSPGAA